MAVQEIDLGAIAPSPLNPRKTFDPTKLAELAESIRAHGVLQPVLVRSMPEREAGVFELVLGERRVRAARLAGLGTVPAVVRPMEDVEVVEAQVIENDQREGVSPLEEADGYELLAKRFGRSVEEIAAKTGRSKAYVYARLKLTHLGKKGRQALLEGTLSPATALFVARLPHDLQSPAVDRLQPPEWRGKESPPIPVREAARIIREEFMRALKGAPFDPADPKLVPKAGACGDCPKRSGNQPDLFGEVDSADVCTDPTCFRRKADAAWKPRAAKERAKGHTVIDGAAAKKLTRVSWNGRAQLTYNSELRDLADEDWVGGNRVRLRSLLPKGEAAPPITVIRAEDGTVIRAIERKEAAKLLRAALPKKPKQTSQAKARAEAERNQLAIAELVYERARATIVEAARTSPPANIWQLLVQPAIQGSFRTHDEILARRVGSTAGSEDDPDLALVELAGTLDEAECRSLVVELLVGSATRHYREDEIRTYSSAWGVDIDAIQAQVERELAAAAPAPKPVRKRRARKETA